MKKKFDIRVVILYNLYRDQAEIKKQKPVNIKKYNKFIQELLAEKTKLIYKIADLPNDSLNKIIQTFNAVTFEFGGVIYLAVVPWYDKRNRRFDLAPWK